MKAITLRTLLIEPIKAKRLTSMGKPVQVTENGAPLWVIHPAVVTEGAMRRRRAAIEAEFAEILKERKSEFSLAKIIIASR